MSNQFDRTLNPDTGFALLLLPLPALASRPGNTGMKKKLRKERSCSSLSLGGREVHSALQVGPSCVKSVIVNSTQK